MRLTSLFRPSVLRTWLAVRYRAVVRARRRVGRWVGVRVLPPSLSAVDLRSELPVFIPNSAGPRSVMGPMILRSARELPERLADLADSLRDAPVTDLTSTGFAELMGASDTVTRALGQLFDRHGSDKASTHDYHLIYGSILDPATTEAILEVGLGSPDVTVPSNMGADGRPGASLRAFRDFLPNADIYGADIDSASLFEDERIRTFHVDQTDDRSVAALFAGVPGDLDLVIDDGLHSPHANLPILARALTAVRVGGWVVIEDIGRDKRSIWNVVAHLLGSERFESFLIDTRECLVFAVRRR